MSVIVRSLRDDDLAQTLAILNDYDLPESGESPEELASYLRAIAEIRAGGDDVLVAELDGQVVGLCQLIFFRHLHNGAGLCAEVESVHVRRDLRSRGIGEAMMNEAERRSIERGCYRIQLTSRIWRTDAHRFYERLNYEQSHQGFKKYL